VIGRSRRPDRDAARNGKDDLNEVASFPSGLSSEREGPTVLWRPGLDKRFGAV
jgi:hypothetical protein